VVFGCVTLFPLMGFTYGRSNTGKGIKTRENQTRRVEPQLDTDDDGLPSLRAARI